MYRVLSIDDEVIVLANTDGHVKRLDRSSFSFDPKLGDRVDLFYDDKDQVIATRAKIVENESGSRAIRSALLQGIFDLFTEVLTIHNDQVGNVKKILSQLFIAFFMVWALVGVVVVELIILIESLLIWAYQFILIAIKYLHDVIAKKLADRARQQAKQEVDAAYGYNQTYDEGIPPEAYAGYEDDSYIVDLDSLELSPDERERYFNDYNDYPEK
ncbi:hypothetical protein [Streptococcus sobrinus]|uniref:hypothetical protein n=1 Tax=Streptococcus sobrinus TaxID=1310 RepID=UPI000314F244|nr:hypothetical protein [Streptococcus sobrinus]AWN19513.1 hypothetical protein DK181_08700 [Streptococcus sobrinus]AWN62249.1 hypothetical protein DLJ52_08695 [Streptococcus sobrinus]AWN64123.1 hypothetical protein DLJ51_08700 [Streptococcus sobrinus]SQG21265.1 membrane protein [Streptococcus sobrinus]